MPAAVKCFKTQVTSAGWQTSQAVQACAQTTSCLPFSFLKATLEPQVRMQIQIPPVSYSESRFLYL